MQRHLCPGRDDAEGEVVGRNEPDDAPVDLAGRIGASQESNPQGPVRFVRKGFTAHRPYSDHGRLRGPRLHPQGGANGF
ncbi:MAG: hypothetical protein ABIP19_05375, partial [Dermatophilaceae bacterium]